MHFFASLGAVFRVKLQMHAAVIAATPTQCHSSPDLLLTSGQPASININAGLQSGAGRVSRKGLGIGGSRRAESAMQPSRR